MDDSYDDQNDVLIDGRRHGFFIVDNDFVDNQCKNLGYLEISVYIVICRFAAASKAWPSYSKICEILKCSRTSAINAMKALEEQKLVCIQKRERTNGSKTSNMYILMDTSKHSPSTVGVPGWYTDCTRVVQTVGGPEEDQLKKTIEKNNTSPSAKGDSVRPVQEARPVRGFQLEGDPPAREPTLVEVSANKLYTAVAAKGKIFGNKRLDKWDADFRDFLCNTDVGKERFEQVLNWYCKHIGEPFVPAAYSADGFVKKFVQIADAMERSHDDHDTNGHSPHSDIQIKIVAPPKTKAEREAMLRDA